MSPATATRASIRETPVLRSDQDVRSAVSAIAASGLPALPVLTPNGSLVGIFGEREFIIALFPGYLGQLHSAAFVPQSIDELLQRRLGCADQPVASYMNTEQIAVKANYSDAEVAEIFLHHRVLLVPVVGDDRNVVGVVTRSDFFKALVEHFVAAS